MENAARRLFKITTDLVVVPAPTLAANDVRARITTTLNADGRVVVYLRSKLGGEISLSPTERSPEVSFDITMVEIVRDGDALAVGKYAILEVQTMDFHGSYERAVQNLNDARRLHKDDFHEVLRHNEGDWISERIEGPNIANVFKRTFYQIMLKFQIGAHESSAGCVLAIPAAVWDSWQRHLARPDLTPGASGTFELRKPIVIQKIISTDADSIAHFAVKVAPEIALAEGGTAALVATTIRRRLGKQWPALAGARVARRRRPRPSRPPDVSGDSPHR